MLRAGYDCWTIILDQVLRRSERPHDRRGDLQALQEVHSKPMPSAGSACHESGLESRSHNWWTKSIPLTRQYFTNETLSKGSGNNDTGVPGVL